jgi:hypothetical protein
MKNTLNRDRYYNFKDINLFGRTNSILKVWYKHSYNMNKGMFLGVFKESKPHDQTNNLRLIGFWCRLKNSVIGWAGRRRNKWEESSLFGHVSRRGSLLFHLRRGTLCSLYNFRPSSPRYHMDINVIRP